MILIINGLSYTEEELEVLIRKNTRYEELAFEVRDHLYTKQDQDRVKSLAKEILGYRQ